MGISSIKISNLDDTSKDAFLYHFRNNVYLFEFTSLSFTSSVSIVVNISKEIMETSVIYMYANTNGEDASAWVTIPAIIASGNYQARYWIEQTQESPSQYTFTIRTYSGTGALNTTAKSFVKLRIYIVQCFPST